MLVKIFKIDINKVKEKNKELIKKNFMDKLNTKQKKVLNFYKGPEKYMNEDGLYGYIDITQYLTSESKFGKIHVQQIKDYVLRYQINSDITCLYMYNIGYDFNNILKEIQKNRINAVVKYIKIFDKMFSKGIKTDATIYRMMSTPFNGNIIKNITSWSLIPIEGFCNSPECHLYVTKLTNNIKVIYMENNSKDKNLKTFQEFGIYEYEFILPRNIEFVEEKVIKLKIPNGSFVLKSEENKESKETKIIVHYINIIKKHKTKENLYKNIPVTLLT
jgi:hypothetical protein